MITLDGASLDSPDLVRIAGGAQVEIAAEARARLARGRAVIDRAVAERRPVYGVTTGLGARATETLDAATLARFSLQTLRGRAQATGRPEDRAVVRAAMTVRLNTLLSGHVGASVAVADHLCTCLNAGLVPIVGRFGSVGPSDLVQNATLGLALAGEGRMEAPDGSGAAAEIMARHGIAPLELGPRDGLALAGHCGMTVGAAALGHHAAERAFAAVQTAAALSLEAFRATLAPLDPRGLAIKPLPGQQGAADDLRRRLDGSALWRRGQARRLQDPLSLRHVAQIHGAFRLALDQARAILDIELNGASDNPVVLTETDEILPTGAYFGAELALVIDSLNRAILATAMAQVARMARLLDPRTSDLPLFLARPDSGSNGFAPLMKTAEALAAEIAQAAQPVASWPSINANGIEDAITMGPVAVRSLSRAVDAQRCLTAIEMLVAVQAIELRGCRGSLGPVLQRAVSACRARSQPLEDDRSLSGDLERLSEAIAGGIFD